MNAARAWLPPGTCHARVDQRIAEAVHGWSRAWLGDERVDVVADTAPRPLPLSAGATHVCAREAWLVAPTDAVALLGHLALQLDSPATPHEADQAIVEAVGGEAFDDLQARLADELGLARSGAAEASTAGAALGVRWTITRPGSRFTLSFVLSEVRRTELLIALMPKPPAPAPLDAASVALAPLDIELAATLGTCDLTVAELRSLSPGDVLLFDRALNASLPLLVDGTQSRHGACTVARDTDQLLLQIIEPLYGIKA